MLNGWAVEKKKLKTFYSQLFELPAYNPNNISNNKLLKTIKIIIIVHFKAFIVLSRTIRAVSYTQGLQIKRDEAAEISQQ